MPAKQSDAVSAPPALTAEQARDAAGELLATLPMFSYDPRDGTLSADLSALADREWVERRIAQERGS